MSKRTRNIDSSNLPKGYEELKSLPTPQHRVQSSPILDAQGRAQPEMPTEAKVKPAPIVWRPSEENKGQFYPVLRLTDEMVKVGQDRPTKEFLPGERLMFAAAFTSDVTSWIFGEPLYLENFGDNGTEFLPNPAFHELPTIDVE